MVVVAVIANVMQLRFCLCVLAVCVHGGPLACEMEV